MRFLRISLLILPAVAYPPAPVLRGQPAAAPPTGMDRAIALLGEARTAFRSVRDYECRLVKRERVRGVLLPESVATMKVRNDPFSVDLVCESPPADKGLEICYVQGRNGGMMRVRPAHIQGVLGFWSVAPTDPRAFEKNRHCITDAGLDKLMEATARFWESERRIGRTVVHIADDMIAGRPCVRIETIHPDHDPVTYYGYRCVLWLDKATRLPAGAETYDWPHGGGVEPDLLESYRFLDLRRNVGLTDRDFMH